MTKSNRKLPPKQEENNLSEVMEQIERLIVSTFHGSVTLIVQDSRLIQIERNEKIRLSDLAAKHKAEASANSKKETGSTKNIWPTIMEAVNGLRFGQIAIVIKEGKIVQFDKTEKQRFPDVEGIYGDGI